VKKDDPETNETKLCNVSMTSNSSSWNCQGAKPSIITQAAIHPREVIRRGLDLGATGLIMVHNHPSGSPEPSRADIDITNRISEAGRLLGTRDMPLSGRRG
jgi:proteasome lid subunit RPN8/RPN11